MPDNKKILFIEDDFVVFLDEFDYRPNIIGISSKFTEIEQKIFPK